MHITEPRQRIVTVACYKPNVWAPFTFTVCRQLRDSCLSSAGHKSKSRPTWAMNCMERNPDWLDPSQIGEFGGKRTTRGMHDPLHTTRLENTLRRQRLDHTSINTHQAIPIGSCRSRFSRRVLPDTARYRYERNRGASSTPRNQLFSMFRSTS